MTARAKKSTQPKGPCCMLLKIDLAVGDGQKANGYDAKCVQWQHPNYLFQAAVIP